MTFSAAQLRSGPRQRIEAACVDMWPFRLSLEEWAPGAHRIGQVPHPPARQRRGG
jgi:hypothetical protein